MTKRSVMATATIPKTVTVPGQVVYEAVVALAAIENALQRMSDTAPAGPFQEELQTRFLALFKGAFGPWFDPDDEDLIPTPLAGQVEKDGRTWLREHFWHADE
jgi:hypothetical protein